MQLFSQPQSNSGKLLGDSGKVSSTRLTLCTVGMVTSVLVGQWKEYFKDPYRKLNLGIRGKTPTLIQQSSHLKDGSALLKG